MNCRLIAFVGVAALTAGCATNLELIPREGSTRGSGVASGIGDSVTIDLAGKTYKGNYVYRSGYGRILATALDGAAIRCEFQSSRSLALGVCEDKIGKKYDLKAKD